MWNSPRGIGEKSCSLNNEFYQENGSAQIARKGGYFIFYHYLGNPDDTARDTRDLKDHKSKDNFSLPNRFTYE